MFNRKFRKNYFKAAGEVVPNFKAAGEVVPDFNTAEEVVPSLKLELFSRPHPFYFTEIISYSFDPSPIFSAWARQVLYSEFGVVFSKWS